MSDYLAADTVTVTAHLTKDQTAAIAAAVEAEARPLFAWLCLKIMRAELDGHGWGDST